MLCWWWWWCDCGNCGYCGLSGGGELLFTAVVTLTPAAVDNLAQTCTLSLGGEQTGLRVFLATKDKIQSQSIFTKQCHALVQLNISQLYLENM